MRCVYIYNDMWRWHNSSLVISKNLKYFLSKIFFILCVKMDVSVCVSAIIWLKVNNETALQRLWLAQKCLMQAFVKCLLKANIQS